MKIHISEATADLLEGSDFIVKERGEMEVKVLLAWNGYCQGRGTDTSIGPMTWSPLQS